MQSIFVRDLRPGDVVFDLGANVGFFTILASRLVGPTGTVYAFEPLPRNLAFLQRHVELNEARNVTIVAAAVSKQSGVARFRNAGSPSMGGLFDDGELEVETLALDEFIDQQHARQPTFVKIDVEGAELGAFQGAMRTLRTSRPTILLSAHGYALRDACSALLSGEGYALTTVRESQSEGDYVILARPSGSASP